MAEHGLTTLGTSTFDTSSHRTLVHAAGEDTADGDTFPRRQALTHHFTLGAPRNFRVSKNGERITFLRSSGPYDTIHSLWMLTIGGKDRQGQTDENSNEQTGGNEQINSKERLIADPRELILRHRSDAEFVADAELALRERTRETCGGIVSYDVDVDLTVAVFVMHGKLWRVNLDTCEAVALPAQKDAFDPRLSPDCQHVAYVSGGALMLTGVRLAGGSQCDQIVAHDPDNSISWGSAEFIAAEEMKRTRGHWWSPDGTRLLAAKVDTSQMNNWYISAPANPALNPKKIVYPQAGAANAVVGLSIFDVTNLIAHTASVHTASGDAAASVHTASGDVCDVNPGGSSFAHVSNLIPSVDVAWNTGDWEYLASVNWDTDGILLAAQTRDQQCMAVLKCDLSNPCNQSSSLNGSHNPSCNHSNLSRAASVRFSLPCEIVHRWEDDAWVDIVAGAPQSFQGKLVTVEDRGTARKLCLDGEPWTPDDIYVRKVAHVSQKGLMVLASKDPLNTHVLHISWEGALTWFTDGEGVNNIAASDTTSVITRRSLEHTAVKYKVMSQCTPVARIVSHADDTGLDFNVRIIRASERELATAIVLPKQSNANASSDVKLPVLINSYGGPHVQRVQNSLAMYQTSQWFADQGFAVVTIDGRGTPGRDPGFERGIKGDIASPVLADQIAGLQAAAVEVPELDINRVAIRGWSFGGYLAAFALLRRPDIFKAAIAGAPVTSWRLYDTHYTERYLGLMGDVDRDALHYDRCDLLSMAPELKRPLMLIHGLADDNVVAAHTLRLSQALTESGKMHTVIPLSGVTHVATGESIAEGLLRIELSFLKSTI